MAEGDIIAQMDGFALDLLTNAKSAEALADKVAAFKEVGKWVAIKNRLEDAEDEGEHLRDLKSRFKSDTAVRTGHRSGVGLRGRHPDSLDADEPDAGTGLEALRARIPRTGNGGDDGGVRGAGGNPGGAAATAPRRHRSIRPSVSSGQQPDAGHDDSGGQL